MILTYAIVSGHIGHARTLGFPPKPPKSQKITGGEFYFNFYFLGFQKFPDLQKKNIKKKRGAPGTLERKWP